jgi:hypothetical protein
VICLVAELRPGLSALVGHCDAVEREVPIVIPGAREEITQCDLRSARKERTMLTWVSRGVRAAKRAGVRGGVVLVGAAVLVGGVLASPASAATVPRPAAGFVPGMSTAVSGVIQDQIRAFYQQVNRSLTTLGRTATTGWGTPQNLGGVLTSGAAAITIGSGTEFADTWVFARGTNHAVWYRRFSDARGTWGPWTSLGGRAIGAPGVTCVGGSPTSPIVFGRGTDNALWQRSLGRGGWISRGGRLASPPAGLPTVATNCPPRLDVFALGTDHAVWEFTGGWHRVGGKSTAAPAAVRLPSGETDLFVRGTDNALWINVRAPGATAWQGWHRVGGVFTSAPAAGVFPFSPLTRSVLALGGDGSLLHGRNVVGTSTWVWTQVP